MGHINHLLAKLYARSYIHNLRLPPWLQIFPLDILLISQSITDQQVSMQGVEAFNGWFFTAKARVRWRESPCGFLYTRSGSRAHSSPNIAVLSRQLLFHKCSLSIPHSRHEECAH
jgi:hypothetical protein